MRVDINKSGANYQAAGIDLSPAFVDDPADLADLPTLDADIGHETRLSSTIDHGAIADNQVTRHFMSPSLR